MNTESTFDTLTQSVKASYQEVYDQYHRKVYATALAVLRQPEDAEDVTQEVFRTLWQKGDSFVPEKGRFSTWLSTMARNRAIDMLRSRQRRSKLVEAQEELPAPPPDMRNELTGGEEAARGEEYQIMKDALNRLPEVQRKALILTYFEGQTHAEIAARLGQPLGTIKARVRRGLLRLREILRVQLTPPSFAATA